MSAPRFWHLILYVDNSSAPQHVTVELPKDMDDLLRMVEDVSGVAIAAIMYWDPQDRAYMPLTSLDPIQRCHGRAQLWLQSNGLRLELVQRGSDSDELRELRRHGSSLNTEYVAFHLVEAHRVTYPLLEQQFYERTNALLEPNAPTMLLWYAGNGNSSSDAVQRGFVLPPRGSGGLTFVTSLSDPRRTAPPPHLQKVLLCEVAVGRVSVATNAASAVLPTGFDSWMRTTDSGIRVYSVPHAHQAIPRYILSLKGVPTAAAAGGTAANSQESSRRETPPRRSNSNDARPPRASSAHRRGHSAAAREPTMASPVPQHQPSSGASTPSQRTAGFACSAHPEEQTTLWCATCNHLVCPYCLSVGQHRGHDGRELDDVVTKFRSSLSEMIHALTDRQDAASRTLDVMRASKREIQDRCKQGEAAVEAAFTTLSALLNAKRQELLDDLKAKAGHTDEHTDTITQYAATCASKRKEYEALLIGAQDTSRTAKMCFVRNVQGPLAEWQSTKSLQPPPLPNVLPAGAVVCTHVNVHPCEAAIAKLCMQKHHAPPPRSDGGSVSTPTAAAAAGDVQELTVLQHQVAIQRSHLDDLTCGYIWNVPQAEKLFHVDQRKDIFSDVFHLCGAAWELRIASEAVPAATPPAKDGNGASTAAAGEEHLQDNLSVYLHSVNHQHRVNFRVILFAAGAGAWHVREAKGWSTEFAGKGWGIRPFCPRKLLLREYVRDGLVKLCVAPIGGLY